MNTGCFKSPFFKGGFRRIIKRLSNPPLPLFRKGGRENPDLHTISIMKRHNSPNLPKILWGGRRAAGPFLCQMRLAAAVKD